MSNAGPELRLEAGATEERTLEAVRCSAWFGPAWEGAFVEDHSATRERSAD